MAKHEAVLGRFLEDFVVGDSYEHPFGRTISETDKLFQWQKHEIHKLDNKTGMYGLAESTR